MKRLFKKLVFAGLLAMVAAILVPACSSSASDDDDDDVTLKSIAVTTNPTKLTYNAGDEFDPTGMVVTATYSDQTTKVIGLSDLVITPKKLSAGTSSVTVKYQGKKAKINVTVKSSTTNEDGSTTETETTTDANGNTVITTTTTTTVTEATQNADGSYTILKWESDDKSADYYTVVDLDGTKKDDDTDMIILPANGSSSEKFLSFIVPSDTTSVTVSAKAGSAGKLKLVSEDGTLSLEKDVSTTLGDCEFNISLPATPAEQDVYIYADAVDVTIDTITVVAKSEYTYKIKETTTETIAPTPDDDDGETPGASGDSTTPVNPTPTNVKVMSITINGTGVVAVGGSINLSATVAPSNASNKGVTYTADSNAVTIDGSKLTGVAAAASVTITATANDGSGVTDTKVFKVVDASSISSGITIKDQGGWLEAAFVEWEENADCDNYNVYVASVGSDDWKKLDTELIRKYPTCWRADALGLAEGNYQLKVVGTVGGAETKSTATSAAVNVIKHTREGFAFMNGHVPGAYKADGTLKDNALVIYLTDKNKDTMKVNVNVDGKKLTECTGLLEVILGYKKGKDTRPLVIRMIGQVKDMANLDSDKNFKGDICLENKNGASGPITLEGVGEDAVADGWGIRLKSASYCEIRNIAIINCDSDEGDDIGMQQDNDHIWVHNCDYFYGEAGSDADQVKGDGALDTKLSNFVTNSYNHFWDNGKCNLLGLKEGKKSYDADAYYITYHHNWYDHSDSRHPRTRYYNAHVYNNFYDGNSKYGAGATLGASVFMDSNYFRSCQYPMMASMQGSDVYAGSTTKRDPTNNGTFSKEDGGTIKSYNNYMTGNCTFIPYNASTILLKGEENSAKGSIDTSKDFDAYVVSARDEKVPNTVLSYQGSNYYSNFDTNGTSQAMYSWTAEEPANAMATVKAYAGRMRKGDISTASIYFDLSNYTPNGFGKESAAANPDKDHLVINALKTMLKNYKGTLVSTNVTGGSSSNSGDSGNGDTGNTGGNTGNTGGDTGNTGNTGGTTGGTSISGSITYIPQADKIAKAGFTITGNTSTSKGTATVNGTEYTTCLKMQSSTKITFTIDKTMKLTMIFGTTTGSIYVEKTGGSKTAYTIATASTGNNVTIDSLEAGEYTISKKDTESGLFYLALE